MTNLDSRYHVGDVNGLHSAYATRAEAFAAALDLYRRNGALQSETVTVFDTMAPVGKPEQWETVPTGCLVVMGYRPASRKVQQ